MPDKQEPFVGESCLPLHLAAGAEHLLGSLYRRKVGFSWKQVFLWALGTPSPIFEQMGSEDGHQTRKQNLLAPRGLCTFLGVKWFEEMQFGCQDRDFS